jgi:hypothetical protein
MDFVPEKSALEVDEVREGEKATGCWPSRPSGEGTSAEGTIEDADDEVPPPIMASEEEEPARVHTVVCEELRPPITEVAYPFDVVVDHNTVLGLANAALPQRSGSHLLALHRFHELRWKVEAVLGPGEHRCNIPRFYQILGEIFVFILLEMIGNSQGFKTFESI